LGAQSLTVEHEAAHMNSNHSTSHSLTRSQWTVVILLFVSVFVNYVDRANLSIAAPVFEKQLALSPLQMGSLLSAFFWTYAFFQLFGLSGWLADRFAVGLVFAWGYFIWSAATITTGFLSGFLLLYIARLILGAGESIAYPCYSRIFAELPQQYRGRANALIDAGTKIGPAGGTFIGGVLLIHFGWRILFIVLGAVGLLWLIPWFKLMPPPVPKDSKTTESLPPTLEVLGVRSAWGTFLGHFCGNYFFYFLLTWLPMYFVQERKLSLGAMTGLTSVVFLIVATATIAAGWISDRLIARGMSPTLVRKSVVVGGLSVASTLIAFAFVGNPIGSFILLAVACLGYGTYASNHWAISQTLAGPAMAGRWTSFQNGVGNLSGIAAPWIAGLIVEINGSSKFAFLLAGVVAMAGALIWHFMVPRVEPVQWGKRPTPPELVNDKSYRQSG
jgi:MFS transporter, ACS family, D-galactonate transporter